MQRLAAYAERASMGDFDAKFSINMKGDIEPLAYYLQEIVKEHANIMGKLDKFL